jgi:biotin carboxylase
MKFLILNRHPLVRRDYCRWLGPAHEAVLVTDTTVLSPDAAAREAELAGYAHVEIVEDFDFNPLVEHRVLALHEKFGFDRIIAPREYDILRAARLREFLGLPGQHVESALAFRDKLRMKDHLSGAGVPVAPYAPIADLRDLLGFIEQHAYPVVVKPRRGGGSSGVHVLRGSGDLAEFLAGAGELSSDRGADLLAEVYVEHELFHVDGLIAGGARAMMWPSSQGTTSCLGMIGGQALRSCLLDGDDPLVEPLRALTTQALEALPAPATYMFHAEIFREPGGRLLFNEVAGRMGGGMIENMLKLGFGVSLPEAYLRAEGGRDPLIVPERPLHAAGLALFPPRPGTVRAIPGVCPVPGIDEFRAYARPGDVLGGAHTSVEKIGSVLARGERRAEVERRLVAATEWFEGATVIDPGPQPALR